MGRHDQVRRASAPRSEARPSRRPSSWSATAGPSNQARQRILRRQGRLDVRPAGDAYEQEADRIADEVLAAKDPEAEGPVKGAPAPTQESPGATTEAGKEVQKKPDVTPTEPTMDEEEPEKTTDATEDEEAVQRKEGLDAPEEKVVEEPAKEPEKEEEEPKAVQKKDKPAKEPEKEEEPKAVQKKEEPGDSQEKETVPEEPQPDRDEEGAVQRKPETAAVPAGKDKAPAGGAKTGREDPRKLPMARPPKEGQKPEKHAGLEQRLKAREAGGMPLDARTRAFFEKRLGRDLSAVRIHADPEAAALTRELKAQAFTRSAHIYFASGRYDPVGGRRLLAHELVHVIQQGAARPLSGRGVGAMPAVSMGVGGVQRANGSEGAPTTPPGAPASGGTSAHYDGSTGIPEGDAKSPVITFDELPIPDAKMSAFPKRYQTTLEWSKKGNVRPGGHTASWMENVSSAETTKKLKARLSKERSAALPGGKVLLRLPGGPARGLSTKGKRNLQEARKNRQKGRPEPGTVQGLYYYGKPEEIADQIKVPDWDGKGKPRSFDIDHIVEIQAKGGEQADNIENLQLLDSVANSSHGAALAGKIRGKAAAFAKAAKAATAAGDKTYASLDTYQKVKERARLVFKTGVAGGGGAPVSADMVWKKKAIDKGMHAERLVEASPSEVGAKDTFTLLTGAAGGYPVPLGIGPGDKVTKTPQLTSALLPYTGVEVSVVAKENAAPKAEEPLGSISGKVKVKGQNARADSPPFQVLRLGTERFVGYLDTKAITNDLRNKIIAAKFSPVLLESAKVTPAGIVAPGRIKPTLSKFLKSEIECELVGDSLTFAHTWSTGNLKVPKPFKVHGGSLSVEATSGLNVKAGGIVAFGIDRVGEGSLGIQGETGPGPISITGDFTFDPKLAENAKVEITYTTGGEGGTWAGKGSLDIGKRKGIKKGNITVGYENETLSASGTAELDVPGFEAGAVSLTVGEGGMELGAECALTSAVPGLKSGKLKAKVSNVGGEWKVSGSGRFVPSIPGFDAALEADYDDGALTIKANSSFKKGKMSGTLEAGVTNAQVGEDGKATGKGTGPLRPFGGGSATIKLTDALQGTAAIRIDEKGEIAVRGEVGLAKNVEVFPRKQIEKELLPLPPLDIPIVGVAVAGQRVGIFLTIGGSLKAKAGVGPGTLEDTKITIDYKPSDEDATRVSGSAKLVAPADAGLTLAVHAGVGAGIPLVSVSAGLEVSGTLGIEGRAVGAVNVDWSPGKGLKMHAEADFSAQPSFTFSLDGYAKVEAGVGPFKADLYSEKWNLGSMKYGSGMEFGVKFPVDYEQGKAFDISLDKVEFRKPDVDVGALLKGLVAKVA